MTRNYIQVRNIVDLDIGNLKSSSIVQIYDVQPIYLTLPFTDSDAIGAHKTIGDHDESKYFSEGIPLATSCNEKPCEFEEEFPWNDVRLPSFIQPIRYDIELTPNLTTLGVKGTHALCILFDIDISSFH